MNIEFKFDDVSLQRLSQLVGNTLQRQKKRLCTAESCTGGWVAKIITDIAGSSVWFDRGFVTYSNEAKQEMLSVPKSILSRFGAVSKETVVAMAEGAIAKSLADISVSISGIAGPGGAQPGKPVGLVWFAWAQKNKQVVSAKHVFHGERDEVRRQAVMMALIGILEQLGATNY